MQINADGIDREATETEVAEIEAIRATAYDYEKEQAKRDKAKKAVADKIGLTIDEVKALFS